MFGYVRAYKPDLTFSQYDIYKGVYCSLCKEIGKRYGLIARMTLSYDFAFFALVRLALKEECTPFKASRCTFNPLKKCLQCSLDESDLEITADISMLMVYYKYLDNLLDSGAIKRFFLRIISPYFNKLRKKAVLRCKEADEILASMHESQKLVEKQEFIGIDQACHPSANALGNLLVLNKNCEDYELVRRLGYNIGRWVYLIDAADDYEDDLKAGEFNPFSSMKKEDFLQKARDSLNLTAGEAINDFEKIKFYRYKPILANVLYDGLFSSMNCVLRREDNNEKSI